MITRRSLLALLACSAGPTFGFAQGISSRNVKPQPRGKPSGRPFNARFTDVAKQAGLTHPVIYGGIDTKRYIVEVVGCGVAFLDYDNDGWLDIFILNGTRLEGAPADATNRLYKNNRDGTFTDVTEKAGLTRTGWASAVTVGDYDNDGFDDLFITYYGQQRALSQQRQRHVHRRHREGGPASGRRALWLRLHVGRLRPRRQTRSLRRQLSDHHDRETSEAGREPRLSAGKASRCIAVRADCRPVSCSCSTTTAMARSPTSARNQRSGAASGSYPMTAVAADFDNDGWPDIYVACDSTPSWLFRNQHDGTFREEGLERGAALSEDGMEQAGMGIGIGDYDLDGQLDIIKTHFADDTNVLYRNDGKGYFDDMTIRAGLGVETRYVGWGAGMVDLDNDGLPDLFFVTGSVYPEVEKTLPAYPLRTPRLVSATWATGDSRS